MESSLQQVLNRIQSIVNENSPGYCFSQMNLIIPVLIKITNNIIHGNTVILKKNYYFLVCFCWLSFKKWMLFFSRYIYEMRNFHNKVFKIAFFPSVIVNRLQKNQIYVCVRCMCMLFFFSVTWLIINQTNLC